MSTPLHSQPFVQLVQHSKRHNVPIILDGAIGTMLDNMGLLAPNTPWSGLIPIEHPTALLNLHREYVRAGAQVITSCTFRASKKKFAQYGLEDNLWKKAVEKAVQIARAASSGETLVAGSIGPIDDCFAPLSSISSEEAEQRHLETAIELLKQNIDVLWFETFGHYQEIVGALRAASDLLRSNGLPFVMSVTTLNSGCLLDGTPLAEVISLVEDSGASAMLVNCIPFFHVENAISQLRTCSLPFGIYANLGIPEKDQDWTDSAHLSPQEYADITSKWVVRGIQLVGACCGSSPKHIAAISATIGSSR